MVHHADGTASQFSYTRSMTLDEAKRAQMTEEERKKADSVDWWR